LYFCELYKKKLILFVHYSVVRINRHYQGAHNTLNTKHSLIFWKIFRPFISAIIR